MDSRGPREDIIPTMALMQAGLVFCFFCFRRKSDVVFRSFGVMCLGLLPSLQHLPDDAAPGSRVAVGSIFTTATVVSITVLYNFEQAAQRRFTSPGGRRNAAPEEPEGHPLLEWARGAARLFDAGAAQE